MQLAGQNEWRCAEVAVGTDLYGAKRMADFNIAVKLLLEQEGGLVDNPHDPGGLTNFGISQCSYPNIDIRHLTDVQAAEIYHKDFWRFDGIQDQRLANLLLSISANMGKKTAITLLQRVLAVPADGIYGPITEKSANANPQATLALAKLAVTYYMSRRDAEFFLRGWLNRILSSVLEV